MFGRVINSAISKQLSRIHVPIQLSKLRLCTTVEPKLNFDSKNLENYLNRLKNDLNKLKNTGTAYRFKHDRLESGSIIINAANRRQILLENLELLQTEVEHEQNKEMLKLIVEEQQLPIRLKGLKLQEFRMRLSVVNHELAEAIYSFNDEDNCSALILEISAGVGGQEAMLFARELYDMYCNYVSYKGWDSDVLQLDNTELGGIRHASAIITGPDAFNLLKYEAGVHRVQRIPSTEKSGRVHTSTVSVAVIPRPDDLDLQIKDKDLKIETKRASGAGGQHVNTTDSAVRIVHIPSGVTVECQNERSQIKNKEIAMKKLEAKLCQQHMDAELAKTSATRKAQTGMSLRNEKIRTYNYNQDRITDHRIEDGTLHNLNGFLEGGESLDELIYNIRRSRRKQELMELFVNT